MVIAIKIKQTSDATLSERRGVGARVFIACLQNYRVKDEFFVATTSPLAKRNNLVLIEIVRQAENGVNRATAHPFR
jgi:hypothetical protein